MTLSWNILSPLIDPTRARNGQFSHNSQRDIETKYREGSHTQLTKVTLSGHSHLTSLASARQRVGRTG